MSDAITNRKAQTATVQIETWAGNRFRWICTACGRYGCWNYGAAAGHAKATKIGSRHKCKGKCNE